MGLRIPGWWAVSAAGTRKSVAGDAEGRPGGKNGSATGDATSTAPGQAKVGSDSGVGVRVGGKAPETRPAQMIEVGAVQCSLLSCYVDGTAVVAAELQLAITFPDQH